MKRLILTLSLFASQLAYATISNCYVYSDTPKLQERCEREYTQQQQDYRNQTDTFNQTIYSTTQSQATAQDADATTQQQNQMNQLLKLLTPEKGQ